MKVKKPKLNNHQLGYSKFILIWTGDFSGRTLIESVRRLLFPVSLGFGCSEDLSRSSVELGQVQRRTQLHIQDRSFQDLSETSFVQILWKERGRVKKCSSCTTLHIIFWKMKQFVKAALPSKSTSPSPFKSTSLRISSTSFKPTYIKNNNQVGRSKWCTALVQKLFWELYFDPNLTCWPSSFLIASRSSDVLMAPSPLVSNWDYKAAKQH